MEAYNIRSPIHFLSHISALWRILGYFKPSRRIFASAIHSLFDFFYFTILFLPRLIRVNRALGAATDQLAVARVVSQRLMGLAGSRFACLLIIDCLEKTCHDIVGLHCMTWLDGHAVYGITCALFLCMSKANRPLEASALRELLAGKPLTDLEQKLLNHPAARWWVAVPSGDGTIGLLAVSSKYPKVKYLDIMVRHIAVRLALLNMEGQHHRNTLRSAQIYQAIWDAREQERKHVARELHDQIIQALIAVNYRLSTCKDIHEWRAESLQVQDDMRSIVRDLRNICADLRPPMLDSLGLISAVRSHVRNAQSHIEVKLVLNIYARHERDIPEPVAICAFRCLQELLLNVFRHANASQAVVTIVARPDLVSVIVRDNGCGFDVPHDLSQFMNECHFGLIGLCERLEGFGGIIKIKSSSGHGAWLKVQIPLGSDHEYKSVYCR